MKPFHAGGLQGVVPPQAIVQGYRKAGADGPDAVRGAGAVQADAAGAQRAG